MKKIKRAKQRGVIRLDIKQMRDLEGRRLGRDLDNNLGYFKALMENDAVLRTRELEFGERGNIKCAVLFMDGMVDNEALNQAVIRPLIVADIKKPGADICGTVCRRILYLAEAERISDVADMLRGLYYGDTVLLFEGSADALVVNTKGWATRSISEPEDERVLSGPREGFNESVMLNVAMIRRRLATPDLNVEMIRVGRRTETKCFICYLGSLVKRGVVEELKRRISKIDIDGVLDTNYIAELVRDHRFSLLKTTGTTERPDVVAARLLEGRVALITDGTPVVMTVPYLFSENFQSDEDYYLNFSVASIGRMLRYICFFLAISVPAVYISLITFHQRLLPTSFAITIAEARSSIPFPSFIECLLLVVVFELLRETGVRMPQSVGHTLSIVGGLVVGQAAVEARIISAPMLIVVALSGIAGLMIPRLRGVVFYWRITFILLSSFFGLNGYMVGVTILVIRIFSLSSFGADYTGEFWQFTAGSLKDSVIRAPWWKMKKRPLVLSRDRVRYRSR